MLDAVMFGCRCCSEIANTYTEFEIGKKMANAINKTKNIPMIYTCIPVHGEFFNLLFFLHIVINTTSLLYTYSNI